MTSSTAAFRGAGSARMRAGDPAHLTRHALAALAHPITLGAIALLLLNDHVLKQATPSILTGKLSDFAGLFFFPFLLVAIVGATPLRRKADALAAACFVATALAFGAIKLSPQANALAMEALEAVLGLPVRIVRDPTDLIALVALWPAWRLWRSVNQRRTTTSARSYLALGLASLAALATTCAPQMPVSRLVVSEGGVYAVTSSWSPAEGVYRSVTGSGWDYVEPAEVPPEVLEEAAVPVALPKVVCVSHLEQTCYRVAGEERLEASGDGGAMWQTVWAAPTARRSFMQRVANQHGQLLGCGKDLDFRAADVVILGQGPDHMAVVALGNEGVLRGRLGGTWSREGVGAAEPTPERGEVQDLLLPSLIIEETLAAILAGAAALVLFSSLAWRRHRTPESEGGPARSAIPWKPGVVVTLLVLILMFALNVEELIPYALAPAIGIVAWAVILWTGWLQTLRGARDSGRARAALALSVLGSVLVALAVWVPFALWVLGTVQTYPVALLLAVAASTGLVALFWVVITRRRPAPAVL